MMQTDWLRFLVGVGAVIPWPMFSDALAESGVTEGPSDQVVAAATSTPTLMVPLRFEASYGVAAADVEVPMWQVLGGSTQSVQNSTDGYFSENRLTGTFSAPLSRLQSVRFGLGFLRGRSGAPGTDASKRVPSLLRFWGLGGDVALVRHVSSWVDLDFGLQADMFSWGVADLGSLQMAQVGDPSSPTPTRLELASGYRFGWQAGVGVLVLGPIGVVMRLGGLLTKITFKGHSKPLEAQGFVASLGVSMDLGRGEL